MTYCVGMVLDEGLVFASDSRTNAGVDHVSTFCKMTVLSEPGQGVIVTLAVTRVALVAEDAAEQAPLLIPGNRPLQ